MFTPVYAYIHQWLHQDALTDMHVCLPQLLVAPPHPPRTRSTDTTNHEQVRMQWQVFGQWVQKWSCLQDAPTLVEFEEELTVGGTPVLPPLEQVAQSQSTTMQKEATYALLDDAKDYPDEVKEEAMAVIAAHCCEHISPDNQDRSGFFDRVLRHIELKDKSSWADQRRRSTHRGRLRWHAKIGMVLHTATPQFRWPMDFFLVSLM